MANRLATAVHRGLSAGYDLGRIVSASSIDAGPLSSTYRIDAEAGRYCLKLQPPELTAENLALEEDLLMFLAGDGSFPAPHLVRTRSGDPHLVIDRQTWSLYEFIEADPAFDWTEPTWNANHCHAAGQALAKFHKLTRPFIEQIRTINRYRSFLAPLTDVLPARFRASIARAAKLAQSGKDDGPALVCRESGMLTDTLNSTVAALNALESRSAAPCVLIHGDYHPGNTLFRGEELCGILDFEYLRVERCAYDLGYALVHFCTRWPRQSSGAGAPPTLEQAFDLEKLGAFIDSYRASADTDDLDPIVPALAAIDTARTALAPYMQFACLLLIHWLLDLYGTSSTSTPEFADRALRHGLTLLRSLKERT